jgi:small subunit ribosomal protein S1
MVDYNLIRSLGVSQEDLDTQITGALGEGFSQETLTEQIQVKQAPQAGAILTGRIVGVVGDEVMVEVGLKSEGLVSREEFDNAAELRVGDKVQVLFEKID